MIKNLEEIYTINLTFYYKVRKKFKIQIQIIYIFIFCTIIDIFFCTIIDILLTEKLLVSKSKETFSSKK